MIIQGNPITKANHRTLILSLMHSGCNYLSCNFNIIALLTPHLSESLFLSGFMIKMLCASVICPCMLCHACLIFNDLITQLTSVTV